MAGLGGYAYSQYARTSASPSAEPVSFNEIAKTASFQCDGRTHCSQMTSCAEAQFFLNNCPGVKMDGNNDGEPCEAQWCR